MKSLIIGKLKKSDLSYTTDVNKNMAYGYNKTKKRDARTLLKTGQATSKFRLHIRNNNHNKTTINNKGKSNLRKTRFVIMFIVILPAVWK